MKRLKKDDMVIFTKNYKDSVQKGEARPIDKAVYIDDKLSGVYIKLDHTWIYLNGNDFEEYCKPYEFRKVVSVSMSTEEELKKMRDIECKLIDEIIKKAEKQMEKKINIRSRVLGLNLNGLDLSDEYGTVERIKDGFVTVQFSDNLVSFPEEELLKRNEESMKHITNFLNKIPNYSSIEEKKEYDYINPSHYRINGKETFDMMVLIWGVDNAIAHCEMTAFKYRMRAGKKPDQPIQRDLDKAKWYEDKANELRNGKK